MIGAAARATLSATERVLSTMHPPHPALEGMELGFMRAVAKYRSAEGMAWANHLREAGATQAWYGIAERLAPARGGVDSAARATALLTAVKHEADAVWPLLKDKYQRMRPVVAAPELASGAHVPSSASFPSGHAVGVFSLATVLATIDPINAAAYWNLADDVAQSAVYVGVHYPTDVMAGVALGHAIAADVLKEHGIVAAALPESVNRFDRLATYRHFGAERSHLDGLLEPATNPPAIASMSEPAAIILKPIIETLT